MLDSDIPVILLTTTKALKYLIGMFNIFYVAYFRESGLCKIISLITSR